MSVSNGLAVIQSGEIVQVDEWTDQRKEFIRKAFCGGAPDDIAGTFLALCERRRLSPEARHVYLVNRAGKNAPPNFVIQTGIDGYRLIADRTGRYVGSDDPVFEYDGNNRIVRATVTVRKMTSGVVGAFTASARMDEYAAGSPMWNKMPHTMIAKCAEALALRKAFPEELSGMYTDVEMDQAETPVNSRGSTPIQLGEDGLITDRQMKRMQVLRNQLGMTPEQLRAMAGVASAKDMTVEQADDVIKKLDAILADMEDQDGPDDAEFEEVTF